MNAQSPIPDLPALIVIEEAEALATFCDKAKLDVQLAKVRAYIDRFDGDASTEAGRKRIASMAYAVTRSKTALEAIGEQLAKDAKDLPKKIDAGRAHVKKTLDAWRDEVRKPVDDWEDAEKKRVDGHNDSLMSLKAIPQRPASTVEEISALIAETETVSDGPDREEFQDGFRFAKAAALASLREKLAARVKYDADQAELAQLRAEREAREAEDRKRREAEEAAQREQERQAAVAKAAADAAQAAERKADADRLAAEARAQAEREAAERREEALKAQAAEAERRAAEAVQRAAEAAQRAREEAAAEAKRKEDSEKAEARERENDRERRGKVHSAALAAFVAGGMAEDCAKQAVKLIAMRKIPHVEISY